jgi:hypothetical protein
VTAVSFFISGTSLVWSPSIPVTLVALAIAHNIARTTHSGPVYRDLTARMTAERSQA